MNRSIGRRSEGTAGGAGEGWTFLFPFRLFAAPFRHRSSTVHTTVQTRAIDRSAPFNGKGEAQ